MLGVPGKMERFRTLRALKEQVLRPKPSLCLRRQPWANTNCSSSQIIFPYIHFKFIVYLEAPTTRHCIHSIYTQFDRRTTASKLSENFRSM
jgi:hypothetical protein